MDSIKKDLPLVVNGGDDYTSVLFTSSGTGGVEAVITSVIPDNGKVLIVENGAYGTRIRKIAERYKIAHYVYSIQYGDYPDLVEIESILKNDREITHLALIDHETTTGMRNPVKEICDVAHAKEVQVIVDCMSSFAGLEIDLQKWKAEYIISSSNKCIQGMAGLSFVIFRKKLLEEIKGNARSFYFDLYAQYTGFYNTGQMQFTPPVQVVFALRKALDLFFEEGALNRIKRYRENYNILYGGLRSLGFKFLLQDEYQSGILLAVKEPSNPEYSFADMHDFLYEKGFTVYPGKGAKEATFRLSILGDLYKEDIENFIKSLTSFLDAKQIKNLVY